eukprot:scaffold96044_cov18-Tisochrysis_lutea.AAC.1
MQSSARYIAVNDDAVLDKAIRIVECTHNRQLGVQIMDYVNAEKEGQIRDEYNFKLNVAMGQFLDAATYALELARFEQVANWFNEEQVAVEQIASSQLVQQGAGSRGHCSFAPAKTLP